MIKQRGSKFKGPIDVDLAYGKIPQIIVHGAEFINPHQFVEVCDLNNYGQCPKSLKVLKYLEKFKVGTLFWCTCQQKWVQLHGVWWSWTYSFHREPLNEYT